MSALVVSKYRNRRARQLVARTKGPRYTPKRPEWLLGLVLWSMVMVLLYGQRAERYTQLLPGQVAPATIVAETEFSYPDPTATALEQHSAVEQVAPVFSIETSALEDSVRKLNRLFDRIIQVRDMTPAPDEQERSLQEALDLLLISMKSDQLLELVPAGEEATYADSLEQSMRVLWAQGLIRETDRTSLFRGLAKTGSITLVSGKDVAPVTVPVKTLATPSEAEHRLAEQLCATWKQPDATDEITALLSGSLKPNLTYKPGATMEAQDAARAGVSTILSSGNRGDILVQAGERIDTDILEKIRLHDESLLSQQSRQERLSLVSGNALFLLISLLIGGLIMNVIRPGLVENYRMVLLLTLTVLFTLVPAKFLLVFSASGWFTALRAEFLIPLALAPLLAAIVIDARAAVVIGLWTAFATAILFGHSFLVLVMGTAVTAVAAVTGQRIRHRAQVFRAGVWIGLAGALFAAGSGLTQQQPPLSILWLCIAAFLGGLLTATLTLLLIPIMESVFKLTTDITLLELSDPGHPLLQRLALEAPGTYHHSLMVAHLAQAAAARIGANDLAVRVCAYFHDIGKLTKPEFFTENISRRNNPHDELTPSMSTLIIISHVKEGVSLALRHKLPACVIDGIRQHHGTGLVQYFLHRARQQEKTENGDSKSRAESRICEEDFRYTGPKPQSRETAILCIADAVEAASRSIDKPGSVRIEHLVNDLIRERIDDGQLDECGLTLSELHEIRDVLCFTLLNMSHGRIAYPGNEDTSTSASKKTAPASDPA